MKLCGDKECRRVGEKLPLSEFYVSRRRKDGKTYYCRECSNRRVNDSRERQRAQRQARLLAREGAKQTERKPMVLSPAEKVLREIKTGNRTREGIRKATGLDEDLISDLLAHYWDKSTLRIVKDGERREFHLRSERQRAA